MVCSKSIYFYHHREAGTDPALIPSTACLACSCYAPLPSCITQLHQVESGPLLQEAYRPLGPQLCYMMATTNPQPERSQSGVQHPCKSGQDQVHSCETVAGPTMRSAGSNQTVYAWLALQQVLFLLSFYHAPYDHASYDTHYVSYDLRSTNHKDTYTLFLRLTGPSPAAERNAAAWQLRQGSFRS